jgi:hypothetical protein
MGLKETVNHMRKLLAEINIDLEKSVNGNKAASQRVRVHTIDLEKVAKLYRKESVQAERKSLGKTKSSTAKKTTGKKLIAKKKK